MQPLAHKMSAGQGHGAVCLSAVWCCYQEEEATAASVMSSLPGVLQQAGLGQLEVTLQGLTTFRNQVGNFSAWVMGSFGRLLPKDWHAAGQYYVLVVWGWTQCFQQHSCCLS